MYNIFVSKIEIAADLIQDEMRKIIPHNAKVVVFPWAFPTELNADSLINDFFKRGGERYQRYFSALKKFGVKEENIIIANCYSDTTEVLRKFIQNADVLLLIGGNPEMFFNKVVYQSEILYEIRHFRGIIIGESAGAELQLNRYFITKENNYYPYQAFYDGFGCIGNPFYLDVHSQENKEYLENLNEISKSTGKDVYAIFDDGAVIYNRETLEIELIGNVIKIGEKEIIKK